MISTPDSYHVGAEAIYPQPIQPPPPTDTPIMFLAGEWGCTPHWYAGFAWQSSASSQDLKLYVYPWFVGYDRNNPPFNAPPFRGIWMPIKDQAMLDVINGVRGNKQPSLFEATS